MLNSIRYFGMSDFAEINRMTLYEYDVRMTAYRLKQVDREYEIHLQAWENWNVQATKKQGKKRQVPVFQTFKQFFDYEKKVQDILKPDNKDDAKKKGIADILRRQKERRLNDGNL